MVRRCGLLLLVMVMLAAVGFAQDSEKKASADAAKVEKTAWSFYKLDLTVREMDGAKVLNSRSYTIAQRSGEWGQLRVGSRLPVATGVLNPTGPNPVNQWQYIDIGLNLDSRVQEKDDTLAFDWRMELSSVAAEPGAAGQPVIRQVKNNGQTLLTLGKPVMMTLADDLSSTHKFVFEVTATKLK
mgnify:CR=1 FL=1|jgi:hypothetical protein